MKKGGVIDWLNQLENGVTRRGLFYQGGLAALLGSLSGSGTPAKCCHMAHR